MGDPARLGFGICFGIKRYYATTAGQKTIDRLMLKAPVLGDVLRKSAVSRFTRTLGTLISSGVSILDGLEITAKTAGNRVIHDAVMESRASIAGGETIAAPLEKSKVFPPMVISMIAVGEQTGGLDEMLTKIADFYDEEVDVAVGALLALMEPIMIVVLGVVVGGMVVAMYLPIFDMMNAIQSSAHAGTAYPIAPPGGPCDQAARGAALGARGRMRRRGRWRARACYSRNPVRRAEPEPRHIQPPERRLCTRRTQ